MVKMKRMPKTITRRAPVPAAVRIPNWIAGRAVAAAGGEWFDKRSPVTGRVICLAARSRAEDVHRAVESAAAAQASWAGTTPVRRGEILLAFALALKAAREPMARTVAEETGKSAANALAETDAAVSLGVFMAGEGQRLYGRTTASGVSNRMVLTVRQPVGVAGLIIAANTPIANIAWKIFPALVCGNSAVLKASEDAPATAQLVAALAAEAGVPSGALNVIHGLGAEAGAALVEHPAVGVVSFTGSSAVGRRVAQAAGARLAKVSLELGGKNPFVVCDDADLDLAVHWAVLSAFSNAGQRCSAGSRIIVLDAVYEEFCRRLLDRMKRLKVGPGDADDFGPVINERQLTAMLDAVGQGQRRGATILTGGCRLTDPQHRDGYYMAPTLIEGVGPGDPLSTVELFGPIACVYRVKNFDEALALANDSAYGLTACIHTRNVNRALEFTQRVQAGIAVVNAGTHGSEAHLPFGGVKASGNGTREPGTEALDVYSNLKNVYLNSEPKGV